MPKVQYAALIADLVDKSKYTLGSLSDRDERAPFHYLRLRTKQDTELIISNYCSPSGYEYILCAIQQSVFSIVEDEGEEEEEK